MHFTGIARIHQAVRFAGAAGIASVGALPLDGNSRKSRDVCDSRVLRVMGEAGSQRHEGAVRSGGFTAGCPAGVDPRGIRSGRPIGDVPNWPPCGSLAVETGLRRPSGPRSRSRS